MMSANRRAFLGGVGMTVATAVAMALTPGARRLAWAPPALPAALAGLYPQGDWHVDDICGHLPRYAHPIPYMHDTAAPDIAALAAPIDRQFIA